MKLDQSQYSLRIELTPDLKKRLEQLQELYRQAFPHMRATKSEVVRYLIVNGGGLDREDYQGGDVIQYTE